MYLLGILLLGVLVMHQIGAVIIYESNSKSHHSESKSHHSKSHHSKSKSHHSHSQSVSPSEAFITTCSTLVSPPAPPLTFPATLLPLDETCKGTKLPHDGNAKGEHPLLHDNLGHHWKNNWHKRRECECSTYRVCVTTNCSNSHHNFDAISTFRSFARLALPLPLTNCHLLPYTPSLVPPGSDMPVTAVPLVECEIHSTHLNTTILGEIVTPYPLVVSSSQNYSVNCTYSTANTVIIDDVDYNLLTCGASGNFYACSEVVQPLDFSSTLVDRATTCSHDHTHSGTPNDGAGKITAWVLIGVVPIVIIIIVAVVLTRQRPGRKGRGTRASDEELETLTGRRG
jgi:hypothetical protein